MVSASPVRRCPPCRHVLCYPAAAITHSTHSFFRNQHMKSLLKRAAVSALATVSAYPSRMTGSAELRRLIASLRPVTTAKPLIRLGPVGDGGYLIPDHLDGITAVFSPGVDRISGFELDCATKGMPVFLADRSVDAPPVSHERFTFTRKFIGASDTDAFMTMDSWVRDSIGDQAGDLLLQIDIEGYEYEAFLSMSDALLSRFRIIAAEFHDLNMLFSEPYFRIASRVFEKLLNTHHCVHIHPNNIGGSVMIDGIEIPVLAEFTFLRKDSSPVTGFASSFPHPLDSDNTALPSLPLPACWH